MSGGFIVIVGGVDTEAVMRDTWGHCDAEPGRRYQGSITFAEGCYGGERMILAADFGDAGYGPWFYQGIHEWLGDQDTEPGGVYRFTGTYRLTKGGGHRFVGSVAPAQACNEAQR